PDRAGSAARVHRDSRADLHGDPVPHDSQRAVVPRLVRARLPRPRLRVSSPPASAFAGAPPRRTLGAQGAGPPVQPRRAAATLSERANRADAPRPAARDGIDGEPRESAP